MGVAHSRIGVGIDTGGTFTDAVAVDLATGELVSKAKAPTTREDLAVGVRCALQALDASLFSAVEIVSLSTTLATNAVVEGKGSRVGLVIAVPNPATFELPAKLPAADVAVVAGAHDPDGSLRSALDATAAREAIARMESSVDAFAVSAYFSVANAEHEVALKALVAEACDAPVVCGHELSQRIGIVERAVTASLNARLLPLVRELLDAVRKTLDELGISAPLMVVKGDGSLMQESAARDRPVETVLSGPAASVIGACKLSGLSSAIVADMGGTTTDIALVSGNMPQVSPDGALVGGWRTRVHALDARTVGLGGDSRIRVTRDGELTVGPDRAIPLCVAAERFRSVRAQLERMAEASTADADVAVAEPVFLTTIRRPARELSEMATALFDALAGAAILDDDLRGAAGAFVDVDELVRSGSLAEIAFTPSDALAVQGELPLGDSVAARHGLALLARRGGCSPEALRASVRAAVTDRLALEVAARALAADRNGRESSGEVVGLLAHLLGDEARILGSRMTLSVPLVAVGAPAAAWFPGANERLGGQLVIPRHAEVANAFGALAGRVLERAEVRVKANPDETFAVITPALRESFADYPTARARAEELATDNATTAALAAGAPNVTVALQHDEVVARQARRGDDVIVELTVVATASGPPVLHEVHGDASLPSGILA